MKRILFYTAPILLLGLVTYSNPRNIIGDLLFLKPDTLPAICTDGQFKVDESDGNLKQCKSGAWSVVAGTGGGSTGINIIENPDAESGTANWTNSGSGTFATTTTAADVYFGTRSFSWDAAAASDTLTSDAVTIPAGLFGANCAAEIYYKGGDTNIKLQAYDGSNVLAETTLSAATTYTAAYVTFICPSSGSLSIRLIASADAAIMYFDKAHLGTNERLSQISQAQFVGSAYFATTADCHWQRANSALGAFTANSACPGPTIDKANLGSWQTTDANLPKWTINDLPPGLYKVTITGFSAIAGGTTTNASLAVNDGTNTRGIAGGTTTNLVNPQGFTVVAWFEYTTAGNRSFELYGASTTNSIAVGNSTGNQRTTLTLERFPLSSQTAYTPDIANWRIDATISGADIDLGTGDTSSYVAGNNSGLTLTQRTGSASVGISCSSTNDNSVGSTTCSAGNEELGVVTNLPRAGTVEICSSFGHRMVTSTSGAISCAFQWVRTANGSQTPVEEGGDRVPSALGTASTNLINPIKVCGIFNVSSAAKHTFRLMYECDNTATVTTNSIVGDASATVGQSDIHVTARYIDQNEPHPNILNTVTSTSSGGVKVVSAFITNSGTPTVTSEDGDWINSLTDNGAGDVTVSFVSGTFLATPNCFVQPQQGAAAANVARAQVIAISSSFARVQISSGASFVDVNFMIFCIGAK